jgi:signal transduction histidine kinase
VREIVPDMPEEFEAAMLGVLSSGQPLVNAETTTSTSAMPGIQRSFLCSFYPIVIGGQTTAIGGVLSEITEQKRVSEQLRRDAELRELFLAVLAHDLRTPLSSISMGANALMLRDDTSEFGLRAAQRIARSAQRMNVMIGQVLDFTRARADGGLLIRPETIDLSAVCSAMIEEFRAAHPDRTFELRAVGDQKGSWDAVRLGQLLGNLMENALRHGANQTPVIVKLEGKSDHVILSVHNQGPAIPQETKATLFEPFRRGKPPLSRGAADGLGLGLYISERIVGAHGGRIHAVSDDNETAFVVHLPRSGSNVTS